MREEQFKECHLITLEGLEGDLKIPVGSQAIVLFAHGSDSSRHSMRNQFVANLLYSKGIATLLVDLLSQEEKRKDQETRHLRHNIDPLAERFLVITRWLAQEPDTKHLKIAYFGSSTGAAAALITAARLGSAKAIVTQGGRSDLVDETFLHQVKAPTLFIVGGKDKVVNAINKRTLASLKNAEAKEIAIFLMQLIFLRNLAAWKM